MNLLDTDGDVFNLRDKITQKQQQSEKLIPGPASLNVTAAKLA